METLLKVDPYNEDAIRRLMCAYLDLGQAAMARQCYRQYERLLAEELGLKPPAHLVNLYNSIG